MNTNNHGKGIDWDGELQMLMESSGIKLAELIRPQWKTRLRRQFSVPARSGPRLRSRCR